MGVQESDLTTSSRRRSHAGAGLTVEPEAGLPRLRGEIRHPQLASLVAKQFVLFREKRLELAFFFLGLFFRFGMPGIAPQRLVGG